MINYLLVTKVWKVAFLMATVVVQKHYGIQILLGFSYSTIVYDSCLV